ncbi:hypothetical protein [Arthrobacter sp. SX1312]|uniref:hypothetical protein n=1 Tax=Arthrobacter sp. SX1312 TaxID=2058896 RepID=UPI0011B0B4C3|nr:hypothetical protein [Arthrobacter sp. SX1312]
MGRELTERERDVMRYMLDAAVPLEGDEPVSRQIRQRLRQDLHSARAGERCACGDCPSIVIEDQDGITPETGQRVVLSAAAPNASVLLFIDGGRLSYLELAPHDDEPVHEFPPVAHLSVN